MSRQISEAFAKLAPTPMNGANQLDMSPGDFGRLCVATELSPFDGRTALGIRVMRDERLIDGVFVGRRNGKAVWSNSPALLVVIETYGDPFAPAQPRAVETGG